MKSFPAYILLLALACVSLVVSCGRQAPPPPPTEPPVPAESSPAAAELSPEGMAALTGGAVALQMDGLKITLNEVLAQFQDQLRGLEPASRQPMPQAQPRQKTVNGLSIPQQQLIRRRLYHLVRQQLILRAARSENLTVTDKDRQGFRDRWEAQNPNGDFNAFLAAVNDIPKSPLAISINDIYLIYKWSSRQLEGQEVPEREVKRLLAQLRQIQASFGKQVEAERNNFIALADKAELYTDEGFAKLAKEHSDGIEADNGGLINDPMTRAEIAAANFGQPFTTPAGETSALIETPTSLRYIRVLKELPGDMPGEPAKLRIAQILYSKRELDNLPTEEEIRTDVKHQMQERHIADTLPELGRKFNFSCPLIPDLLDFEKLSRKPAPEEDNEAADDAEE